MTATLTIRRRPQVDPQRAAAAASDAVVLACQRALDRAGLVATGAMRRQLTARVDREGNVLVGATGNRRVAAAVQQARRQWAKLLPADRQAIARAVRAQRGVVRKVRTAQG